MQKILMVDDEVLVAEALAELFRDEQIELISAEDAQSAATLMEAEFYPVILADVRLRTEAEGLQLLESIRRLSPGSRVASVTGFATPALEAQLRERGAELVLYKPVGFDELLRVVRELLEAREEDEETEVPVDFDELYTNLQKLLYSLPGRRYGLTADETEEVVQQAWCLLIEKQSQIKNPKAWLAGTVVNLCKQEIHRKMNKREVETEEAALELEYGGDAGSGPDDVLIVRQALDRVDQRSRDLCQLIGMEKHSYEEVSEILDLPLGSVGPLFIRAKAKLKREIAAGAS
ncbi:MAG: sigma-70 family RNA polymerase sigma factor [Acidobacteria bacterium]|nr:sigma-70 family RNA polymerase sigma factor [Acidobacteriota bacterium]